MPFLPPACLVLSILAIPQAGMQRALNRAEAALEANDIDGARDAVRRVIERAPRAVDSWNLRSRWAEAAGDRDALVHALHRVRRLSIAQGVSKKEIRELHARLIELDPVAEDLFLIEERFLARLEDLAKKYEADRRPHSAIRVHRAILTLDPGRATSEEAIARMAAAPDPSLAADARPRDLLEGVSEEWIAEFDEEHLKWGDRGVEKGKHYRVQTNAGYEVLVRTAEAMDQMQAFYRDFFQFDQAAPRLDINLFRTKDEYLKRGQGPPVEWSGGHYTGTAVETYIPAGGSFDGMVGLLFHEAAHQFVHLATNASGWLNEGLASFFEGCRILPNGTVLMNLPANNRLFPLVARISEGWMADAKDGIDRNDTDIVPEKAPTFRIVLENSYEWGPSWYAPTWGVVYFLYNYQDPIDGRYPYRESFLEFVNNSAGSGGGAVRNFEQMVLENPAKPTRGVDFPGGKSGIALPRTVDELNEVWGEWLTALRHEQAGLVQVEHPFAKWAQHAVTRGDVADAVEHYERALRTEPLDAELHIGFAELLLDQKEQSSTDRAVQLLNEAARLLDSESGVEKRLALLEKLLKKHDPHHETLSSLRSELASALRNVVQGYLGEGLHLRAMELAQRYAADFGDRELVGYFAEALRRSNRTPNTWRLAYNEDDLGGWSAVSSEIWSPEGERLVVRHGEYDPDDFLYTYLTLQEVTTGDFSLEAEIFAPEGQSVYSGIVFGRKSDTDFHSVIFLPRSGGDGRQVGFVDLATFFSGDEAKTWRHLPVSRSVVGTHVGGDAWNRLRVDVSGTDVDIWWNDTFLSYHSFPSEDVLRGSLGLLAGRGEAAFRNVRYQARNARDETARIEREFRLEGLDLAGGAGGSWLGENPPFPQVAEWVQGERKGWKEAGVAPQLLVLWSIAQNKVIPLHGWLGELDAKYGELGLQIVSVAEVWDLDKLEGYLAGTRFPGVVGADHFERQDVGRTFERYGVHGDARQFDLPRLVLIDIDGRVVWEGDPGFRINERWQPGKESYLDGPLEELVRTRRLEELRAWHADWESVALPALAVADVAGASPVLLAALEHDWRLSEDVLAAQRRVGSIRTALDAVGETATDLTETGHGPALRFLIEWGESLGYELERKTERALRPHLKGALHADWKKAFSRVRSLQRKLAKGDVDLDKLLDELSGYEGAFPPLLAEKLRAVDGDPAALSSVAAASEELPALWLTEHLGW